ncbi:hypothetical protein [Halomicrobium sp. LC1Hm]|uniref:hypothetical protein n=1 Tax=Halomicrobium sp. LC1Hm TaxID=2610902 RepID=UPI001298510E|nr:hypothetical protein [Halomicrobium sp. LC1Hm]QGA81093.1 putative ATPase, AAA+ superfamily [Halomicrobium sp. LC1Hm]
MTDSVDEHLLTAAKLYEQVRGDLDGDERLLPHTAIVDDAQDRAALSFLETAFGETDDLPSSSRTFEGTSLGRVLASKQITDTATQAVAQGNGSIMSHLVGVTEQDLDASSLRLPMMLLDQIENNGAPSFITAAGNPNTGKTNTAILLIQLRALDLDDLLVLSNVRTWDQTDIVVTSAHDLAVQLLEHRDRPKAILIDEGSTHFDARTNRHEVAEQYTPLAKRYAKIGVDMEAVVVHTGKDLHPERKRLSTLAMYKAAKKSAEFFDTWPAGSDAPTDRLFGGSLEQIEKATGYDPDDAAPWAWDLRAGLFEKDINWDDLLDLLRDTGPIERSS